MKYFREDKETGEVMEIPKAEALARLSNHYIKTEETLGLSSKDNKLTTGFANYWTDED